MKLLICTQKVDANDSVLGFFHRWIEMFAEHCEEVSVICLERGEHHVPDNVSVYSLGKEQMTGHRMSSHLLSRAVYASRFLWFVWKKRKKYDAVFVHMNPEYLVLAGWFWRLSGKKTAFWYNHAKGGSKVRFAALFANRVLYTSSFAYVRRFSRAQQMPAGVDVEKFKIFAYADRPNSKFNILSLGRISPVKYIEVMIDAFTELDEWGVDFVASIYGDPTENDRPYYRRVYRRAEPLIRTGRVAFHAGVPHDETPDIYRAHDVFLNATPKGSLDKTVLEAMACGTIPVVCNESFRNILPKELFFTEGSARDLAVALELLSTFPKERRRAIGAELRTAAEKHHSLRRLVKKVMELL